MNSRRLSREAALQALYMCDLHNSWNLETVHLCFSHFNKSLEDKDFALSLCRGVIENKEKIDKYITSSSENWTIDRMASIDRNILRLAAYEIFNLSDGTASVSINEAIEIAKDFSTPDSPSFINGVLDKINCLYKATT